MKTKAKKLFSFFLTLTILFSVCMFTGCEKGDYTWTISLSKTYLPLEGRLSVLPWFTTLDEAKEILKLDKLSKEQYKIEESSDGTKTTLIIYNVKVKEISVPLEMNLVFKKSSSFNNPNITEKTGFLLCYYLFGNPNKDQKSVEAFANDREKWLNKADKSYRKELEKANLDPEMFQMILEDPAVGASSPYHFSGESKENPIFTNISFNEFMFRFGFMPSDP